MMVLAFVALFLEVDMSDMWSFKAAMWQWQMATARFYLMRIEAQLETQVFGSENELPQNSDRLLDYQILSDIFLDTIGVFPISIDGNLSSGFFLPASHGFRLTIETGSTGCWSSFNEANINSWVPRFGPCSFCYALCPMKQSAAMRLFAMALRFSRKLLRSRSWQSPCSWLWLLNCTGSIWFHWFRWICRQFECEDDRHEDNILSGAAQFLHQKLYERSIHILGAGAEVSWVALKAPTTVERERETSGFAN